MSRDPEVELHTVGQVSRKTRVQRLQRLFRMRPWERGPRNLVREARRRMRVGSDYNIIGLCSTGHGASMALISARYGVRALNLERFIGKKNALWMARDEFRELCESDEPVPSDIRFCLRNIQLKLPPIAIFEDTWEPMLATLVNGLPIRAQDIDFVVGSESHFATNKGWLGRELSSYFPHAVVRTDLEHHAVHRYQAFLGSGFAEAAILTEDASGESLPRLGGKKIAMTLSSAEDARFSVFAEHTSPESSPGRVYNVFNNFLGFEPGEEGKTMGLSSYGRDDCYRHMRPLLTLNENGSFDFPSQEMMRASLREYGVKLRRGKVKPNEKHEDVARAAQLLLDDMIHNAIDALQRGTSSKNLCLAGGTALNSVTNERVFRGSRFEHVYIMPNAGDLGHSLGCALYAERIFAGGSPRSLADRDGLGPAYTGDDVAASIRERGLTAMKVENAAKRAAQLVAEGKIVGWFQGGSEFGPRSLGFRSILADCRDPGMKDRLNDRVKHRESFRPFAPAVLAERATEYFDLRGESPFMLRVVDVHPAMREVIPSVTHVDGTARVQTVSEKNNSAFYALITEFDRLTGVPVVLNTSFNVAGRPIVETPGDAIDCFLSTDIDALILHDFVLTKEAAA